MHPREIQEKIDIVLEEEKRAYAARGRGTGGLGSMNIGLQSVPNNGCVTQGEIPQLFWVTSDPTLISSPNARVLLKLYSSLDETGRIVFRSYLTCRLTKDSPYASVAYFIFFVLYRTGDPVEVLSFARQYLSGDTVFGYSNVLGMLSMIISQEYLHINKQTYENMKLVLQGDDIHFQLREKINLAKRRYSQKPGNRGHA